MKEKRFVANDRVETILNNMSKDKVPGYINQAVADEMLPSYSRLRTEAAYLLDLVADDAKAWRGPRVRLGVRKDSANSPEYIELITRQTVGRGVMWLSRGHHIKKAGVLRELLEYFCENPWGGGVEIEKLSDSVIEEMKRVREKLKEIDPACISYSNGLGELARDVLDHWAELWDWDDAYNVIASAVYCETVARRLKPLEAIGLVRRMEDQFIAEAIGEEDF